MSDPATSLRHSGTMVVSPSNLVAGASPPPSVAAAEVRKRHREGQGEATAVGVATAGRTSERYATGKDRAPPRPRVAQGPLAQVPLTSALLALQKRRGGGTGRRGSQCEQSARVSTLTPSHRFESEWKPSDRCGTPGCMLPDFHDGLCSTEQVLGSTRHGGAVPRRLTLTLAAATGVSSPTPSGLGCSKCRHAPKGCSACQPARDTEMEGRMNEHQAHGTRACGTRGCTLPDHHDGLCSTEQVLGLTRCLTEQALGLTRDRTAATAVTGAVSEVTQAYGAGKARGHAVGARITARCQASTHHRVGLTCWYDGTVAAQHKDGTYRIHYDDGEEEVVVFPCFVIPRGAPKPPPPTDQQVRTG